MNNPSALQRLQDLESRYIALEQKLPDTPEKEAISVLHAMLQEGLRSGSPQSGDGNAARPSDVILETIANLYKQAPAMEGQAENTGLPVGTKAPDFSLPDSNGKMIRLSVYRGRNVVLVFYPLDWSPACSDQLSLYQNELAESAGLGSSDTPAAKTQMKNALETDRSRAFYNYRL